MSSKLGELTVNILGHKIPVFWMAGPKGLEVMRYGHETLEGWPQRSGLPTARFHEEMRAWLKDYEVKKFRRFDLPLDLSRSGPFQAEVLKALTKKVPAGKTVSYGELAELAGRPNAFRAAATTMATHDFAFAVPCHRVMHGSGDKTAYGKGVAWKYLFLKHEGADPDMLARMVKANQLAESWVLKK